MDFVDELIRIGMIVATPEQKKNLKQLLAKEIEERTSDIADEKISEHRNYFQHEFSPDD